MANIKRLGGASYRMQKKKLYIVISLIIFTMILSCCLAVAESSKEGDLEKLARANPRRALELNLKRAAKKLKEAREKAAERNIKGVKDLLKEYDDAMRRNRYFHGKMLSAKDFHAEQSYHILKRHVRILENMSLLASGELQSAIESAIKIAQESQGKTLHVLAEISPHIALELNLEGAFERNNYFYGKLMDARDLEEEQKYFCIKMVREYNSTMERNRYFHGKMLSAKDLETEQSLFWMSKHKALFENMTEIVHEETIPLLKNAKEIALKWNKILSGSGNEDEN